MRNRWVPGVPWSSRTTGASEASAHVFVAAEPGRAVVGTTGQAQPPASARTPAAAAVIVTMFRLMRMHAVYLFGPGSEARSRVSRHGFTRSEDQDAPRMAGVSRSCRPCEPTLRP